jgi:hypothetical protein
MTGGTPILRLDVNVAGQRPRDSAPERGNAAVRPPFGNRANAALSRRGRIAPEDSDPKDCQWMLQYRIDGGHIHFC